MQKIKKNPHFIELKEVMMEDDACFTVFEYVSHDLQGLTRNPSFRLELGELKHLFKQVFEALNFMHGKSILHRDIKASNILVTDTGMVKLGDFGLARYFNKKKQEHYTNRIITMWYRPPELLLGETAYGPMVDIWSSAVVFLQALVNEDIFPGRTEMDQLERIYDVLGTPTVSEWPNIQNLPWFKLLIPGSKKKDRFKDLFENRLTPQAIDLCKKMFQFDPAKRPNAAEILKYPFFTEEAPEPLSPEETLKKLGKDWHELQAHTERKKLDAERNGTAPKAEEEYFYDKAGHVKMRREDAKRICGAKLQRRQKAALQKARKKKIQAKEIADKANSIKVERLKGQQPAGAWRELVKDGKKIRKRVKCVNFDRRAKTYDGDNWGTLKRHNSVMRMLCPRVYRKFPTEKKQVQHLGQGLASTHLFVHKVAKGSKDGFKEEAGGGSSTGVGATQ